MARSYGLKITFDHFSGFEPLSPSATRNQTGLIRFAIRKVIDFRSREPFELRKQHSEYAFGDDPTLDLPNSRTTARSASAGARVADG